jgi:hypothetical protein
MPARAGHARPLPGRKKLPGFARLRRLTIGAQATNLPHDGPGFAALAAFVPM